MRFFGQNKGRHALIFRLCGETNRLERTFFMAKTMNRRQLRAKLALLLLLVVILGALSAGFLISEKRVRAATPEADASDAAPAATTEPQTEPLTEAVPAAEPATSALPKSTNNDPIIVSPTGDGWETTLVNLQYRLPEGYEPTLAPAVEGSSVQLDRRVAPHYAAMYAAAKADGCILTPYSGYRSYAHQQENFNRRVASFVEQGLSEADAKAKTQTRILPPGCSEHNMGFAMDVVSASADFVETKEFKWLTEHAYAYGFILRYPENKTDITGVMYEPWHWRYVGEKAAKEIFQSGQCLEEYLGAAAAKQ